MALAEARRLYLGLIEYFALNVDSHLLCDGNDILP